MALPTTSQGAPPPLIGALLRMPWEAVRDRLLSGLHERGFSDLNASHLTALRYPGPDGMRPSDLAAQARMSKQALNYLLGQLERLGYLVRRDDPRDQRVKRIALTPRGWRAASAMREIVTEVEAEWAGGLGAERFELLRELLEELNDLVAAGGSAGRQGPGPA